MGWSFSDSQAVEHGKRAETRKGVLVRCPTRSSQCVMNGWLMHEGSDSSNAGSEQLNHGTVYRITLAEVSVSAKRREAERGIAK